MAVRVTFQPTADDYHQGYLAWRALPAWRRWLVRLAYVVLAMAILLIVLGLFLDHKAATVQNAVVGIFCTTLCLVFLWQGPRFSSGRQFRKTPSAQSPVTLNVSDAGLETHSIHGASKVSWSTYVAWTEAKSVFVILPQPRIYIPIPKRAFTEEQINEFREILRRNIVPKK
jgi:YcxB-like protein